MSGCHSGLPVLEKKLTGTQEGTDLMLQRFDALLHPLEGAENGVSLRAHVYRRTKIAVFRALPRLAPTDWCVTYLSSRCGLLQLLYCRRVVSFELHPS